MRSWKAQKRLQNLRGRRSWSFYLLTLLAAVLTGLAVIVAVFSCVPTSLQIQSMILTWFFAAIGIVLGITLYVLGERHAQRLLLVNLVAMAVSLVAAIVR